MSQDYPATLPSAGPQPWLAIDFRASAAEATRYLHALRDYVLEGQLESDFRPEHNTRRRWFHVPYMTYGSNAREALRGLTAERVLNPPELGVTQRARNFAVGLYNDRGGWTLGRIWQNPAAPNVAAASFPVGTVVFKALFTEAGPSHFPAGQDITAGAPAWVIADAGALLTVRLLQLDVAVRESRSPTGWVYGTFAYDPDAPDTSGWHRLRPVGLMWGNDPGYTPADRAAGRPLAETLISAEAPGYALSHLGWAGRLNGPVDNPVSSCISCHSTAQYPVVASMTPYTACNTVTERLQWFRNLSSTQSFGNIERTTCAPGINPPALRHLGTSLQVQVALRQQLDVGVTNPCTASPPAPAPSGAAVEPLSREGTSGDP